jgi:hypothetical protein
MFMACALVEQTQCSWHAWMGPACCHTSQRWDIVPVACIKIMMITPHKWGWRDNCQCYCVMDISVSAGMCIADWQTVCASTVMCCAVPAGGAMLCMLSWQASLGAMLLATERWTPYRSVGL